MLRTSKKEPSTKILYDQALIEGFREPPRTLPELKLRVTYWLRTPQRRPSAVIDSTDNQPSKWRKYWYADIAGTLYFVNLFNLITDETLKSKIAKTIQKWTSEAFQRKKLIVFTDIREANSLLREILTYITNQMKLN